LQYSDHKEDELSRSVSSYRTEENVCQAFTKFLKECWRYQSTLNEQKMKQINALHFWEEKQKSYEPCYNMYMRQQIKE
ncbi:hypothetical protein Leryth_023185, partial [Lithospermum erythrorhizon]